MLAGSLTSSVATPGNSLSFTRRSCVVHSPPSTERVLMNAVEDESDTHSWRSSSTLVSTVWVVRSVAKALKAPPMATTATSPAMTAAFITLLP